ncbi:Uncharacterized protein TCAP_06114 [Tolypocladium capitatum]|uniref:Nephrocystin 3-like N-terminal domain-containing protein n=1 Tax=Tolypocladium capitatum TaxID=45235 RepID=A0A2K3Q8R1_9HYPO|nr:Uncharacterized protein TCAP_06114 [Tolypocladium capitatum]
MLRNSAEAGNEKPEVITPRPRDAPPSVNDVASGKTGDSNCWESAYQEALHSFGSSDNEHETHAIGNSPDVNELLSILRREREGLSESSWFQKGLEKLRGPLGNVDFLLHLGRAVASLDPTASTAVGILSAVTTIAVGACGAAETVGNNIVEMIKVMPIVDRCDIIHQSDRSEHIRQALVDVYKEVITFYLETHKLLNSKAFTAKATVRQLSGELDKATRGFNGAANRLKDMIYLATKEDTLEIKEGIRTLQGISPSWPTLQSNRPLIMPNVQVDGRINTERFQQIGGYHDRMKRIRNDEACQWIFRDASFGSWLSAPTSQYLTFFGVLGCGKSVTTSCIVDYLEDKAKAEFPHPLILHHYCKIELGSTGSECIYISLLRQMLTKQRRLYLAFQAWYDEELGSGTTEPMLSIPALESFLIKCYEYCGRPLYVVLDGLDECDEDTCRGLISFLDRLRKLSLSREGSPPLKVMFSSRNQVSVRRLLSNSPSVSWFQSLSRDRLIAEHHINMELSHLPPESKSWLIRTLPELSHGSALWIYLVVKNVRASYLNELHSVRKLIDGFPAYSKISETYASLFDRITGKDEDTRNCLSLALETLATAQRPMDVAELSYAVALDASSGDFTTLSALAGNVEPKRVRELIGPFVTSIHIDYSVEGNAAPILEQVALIHQSLTQLVQLARPSNWTDDLKGPQSSADKKKERQAVRKRELHGQLLRSCVGYLLLDEFDKIALLSPQHRSEEAVFDLPFYEAQPDEERFLDPVASGFGPFFTYAACHWLAHAELAAQDSLPSVAELVKLSAVTSKRRENWVEQYCRPDCTRGRKFEMPYRDPLAIAACFGSSALLAEMLDEDLDDWDTFVADDPMLEAERLMLEYGRLATYRSLFQHPKARQSKFFFLATTAYFDHSHRVPSTHLCEDAEEWEKLFGLVYEGADVLVDERLGNGLLCHAAKLGCMPMLRSLFGAASRNASLRAEMLRNGEVEAPRHMSVGEAVRWNQFAAAKFLLQQPGIGTHTRYRNSAGDNVYHLAAESDCGGEMARLLFEHFNEGVDERNGDGQTPLDIAVFFPNRLEFAQALVRIGHVDIRGGRSAEMYRPLRVAVRRCNQAWCSFLVDECGADPSTVLELDADGNSRFVDILDDIPGFEEESRERKQSMLEFICSLAKTKAGKRHRMLAVPGHDKTGMAGDEQP